MQNKHVFIQTTTIAIVCLLVMVLAGVFYMNGLKNKITSHLWSELEEIATKNSEIVQLRIERNFSVLHTISETIKYEDIESKEKFVEQLARISKQNDYKRIGLATPDGKALTSDGYNVDVSHRDYFKKAIQGEDTISDVFTDMIGDEVQVNAYATPLYEDGQIKGVLFIIGNTNDIAEDLLRPSFEGQGFSLLCDNAGEIVLRTDSSRILTLDSLKNTEFFTSKAAINEEKIYEIESSNTSYYTAVESLDSNQWYVVSVIPQYIISSRFNELYTMAVITWIVLFVIFMILMISIFYIRRHNRKVNDDLLFKDKLTGRSNFNHFKQKSALLLETNPTSYTMVEFDIRDFKTFNSVYGYNRGDDLLKVITDVIHQSCGNDECCARISNDRFVMLLKEEDKEQITIRLSKLDKKIHDKFHETYENEMYMLYFGVYRIQNEDQDLMKCLDNAVYAKNFTKKVQSLPISFYTEEMSKEFARVKMIEEKMDSSLKNNEFVVYLQPKVDLSSFRIISAEALIRWIGPDKKIISPAQFIPIFERNGFLKTLDMFVLEKVCQTLKSWQEQHWEVINISINISRSYILTSGLAQEMQAILNKYQIAPSMIELEITESVIMDASDELLNVISNLKEIGFRISMDDFGSGYSSLNMLKEVPIDVIKLDQTFFHDDDKNRVRGQTIVEGLLNMIASLHIDTVAEGIETSEQIAFLKRVNCHCVQGYYFYKPMPIHDLEVILNDL